MEIVRSLSIEVSEPEPEREIPVGRLPRVSKLMALAIRYDGLMRAKALHSYAEIAECGHLTRARVTQIMNLTLLAPDIIEELLFLPRTQSGFDRISERDLRPLAKEPLWKAQRRMWEALKERNGAGNRSHR